MTRLIPKGSLPPSSWMARSRHQLAQYMQTNTSEVFSSTIENTSFPHTTNTSQIYQSAARDQVPLQLPYPVVPSSLLKPGHAWATHHPNGSPLVIYRDLSTNKISAHVNACKHRGSPLLLPTKGNVFHTTRLKAPRLTCPYHAWVYDAVSGNIKKIPGHDAAFHNVDTASTDIFNLTTLKCHEQAGMVWVHTNTDTNHDKIDKFPKMNEIGASLKPFLYDYDNDNSTELPAHASQVIGYQEWQLNANWQLLVEAFLESYHVKYLHSSTLSKVTHPTWSMTSDWMDDGWNVRHVVPLRNFDMQDNTTENNWNEPDDTIHFLGQTSTTHLIFPMTLVSLFKRLAVITTIEPSDMKLNTKNRSMYSTMTMEERNDKASSQQQQQSIQSQYSTQSKVRAWGVSHCYFDPATESDGVTNQQRDFAALMVAVQEDWDCCQNIQSNLNANANNGTFQYGGYEGNNVQFLTKVGEMAQQLDSTTTVTKSS